MRRKPGRIHCLHGFIAAFLLVCLLIQFPASYAAADAENTPVSIETPAGFADMFRIGLLSMIMTDTSWDAMGFPTDGTLEDGISYCIDLVDKNDISIGKIFFVSNGEPISVSDKDTVCPDTVYVCCESEDGIAASCCAAIIACNYDRSDADISDVVNSMMDNSASFVDETYGSFTTLSTVDGEIQHILVLNDSPGNNLPESFMIVRLSDADNSGLDIKDDLIIIEQNYHASESSGAIADEPSSSPTTGERNALASANTYLKYSAFSYSGLIDQLEFEGYTNSEAVYAVDNCGADWKEQAAKSAETYLKYSAFSYTGLIKQLEFEGFTSDEATYGADQCNADWKEQAAKSAEAYLKYTSFSRQGLINQLEYEGFTHDQAVYGVEQNGY